MAGDAQDLCVRIGRVLACVGASPWLEFQVETVVALARALNAEATLLHVSTRQTSAAGVRERIESALASLGASTEIALVSDDDPARAILREVSARGADLVYAGAAAHEPVLTDILGSTARRIAREARCSVLLDAAPSGRAGAFPTAVVSVRLDAPSRATAGFVLDLARARMIETVHIVHEIHPAPHSAMRSDSQGSWRITRARADAELREFVAGLDCSGVSVQSRCLEGRDQAAVVAFSRSLNADLVAYPGPRRRIRTIKRLFGDEYEALLTDLPSALLLTQARRRATAGVRWNTA